MYLYFQEEGAMIKIVAGCLFLTLCGCGSVRQEVAVNLQMDLAAPSRAGKVDVTVYMVR